MRKRLTQVFPFLLPIRKKQKLFCFYTKMSLDSNTYVKEVMKTTLPFVQYETTSQLINKNTGFDIKYQENKVFNLILAIEPIDGIMIKPTETFSLWRLIRYADKVTQYKEGLTVVNGETIASVGGGLCQLSNLLFDLFLHSPLTIIERHGHRMKEFPELSNHIVKGIDATIAEGWLDLKVVNETNRTYQVKLNIQNNEITATLYCDKEPEYDYEIINDHLHYFYKDKQCIEEVDVIKVIKSRTNNESVRIEKCYTNRCIIAYELPNDIKVEGEK
ncbi:glycopeptide resistance accessory protein VanW [Anaerorhabdus sp.]|uniref:glycopeptide resistance accessory protein VanW n=1 Tax=Anaerorhabdus sp. TaxID=1872524 RepID=UPI002FC98A16